MSATAVGDHPPAFVASRLAQVTLPLAVGALLGPLGVIGIFWANAILLFGAVAIMINANAAGPSSTSQA